MGKVSIVGAGMRSHPGVAAKVFGVLAGEGVNIDMISTSPIKISCVIERDRVERAVQALHSAFELSGEGTIADEEPFRASADGVRAAARRSLPEASAPRADPPQRPSCASMADNALAAPICHNPCASLHVPATFKDERDMRTVKRPRRYVLDARSPSAAGAALQPSPATRTCCASSGANGARS